MNALIYWEDRYFQRLQSILGWVRSARTPPIQLPSPNVYPHSARGLGQFQNYVKKGWPIARAKGITNPKSQGPIDVLICVADADRAGQCCPGLDDPHANSPTSTWVEDANERWTKHLRTFAEHDTNRIIGRFLRWNKESIVISCFDQQEMMAQLCMKAPVPGMLDGFLGKCEPDPRTHPDQEFVDTYRSPNKCLLGMMRELGHTNPEKNQTEVNDALGEFPRLPSGALLERIPDLVSLADLINGLHYQLHELSGVALSELQTIFARLLGATKAKRAEITLEAERLLGTDYRILGLLTLDEEQAHEHRLEAARLFSALFVGDQRQPHLKADEQAILDLLYDCNHEAVQDAVLKGLSTDD